MRNSANKSDATRWRLPSLLTCAILITASLTASIASAQTLAPNLNSNFLASIQDEDNAANQPAEIVDPDSAQNDAAAPEAAPAKQGISFLSLLSKGGWFMVPLILLSLLVVAIGVERFLTLRRDKVFPAELVDQISALSNTEGGLDPRRAYQVCQRFPSSASQIMRAMLTRVGRPQSEIESGVNEAAQREANRLSNLGSWLTLAAAVAPLIGLLGTVWGITQAFYDTTQLMDGQNRSEALAQGIYTALVTTMVGLMIAIPAAVLAHYCENRIINLLNEIEEMIFNLLPQFERYEGKLRFTAEENEANGSASAPAGSDSGRLQIQKPGRRRGKRTEAPGEPSPS